MGGGGVIFDCRIEVVALCSIGNVDVEFDLVGADGGTKIELDFPR